MNDKDGLLVAREFYQRLLAEPVVDVGVVPYALNDAVAALRAKGAPAAHWATFIYTGA
jgi:hypothetical protein